MNIIAATDIGKVRTNNEDNFAFGTLEQACFAVVCDGMGGVEGGEVASEIAVNTIKEQLELAYSPKMKPAALERMLISSVTAANVKIYDYAASHNMVGMGTTVVLAFVKDDGAYIAYDGDSRAYLINDSIRCLTTDHTYVNELFRLGKITKEQMISDSRKNIITRALGVSNEIDVDVLVQELTPGDILLLCSDGLTNCLTEEQILEITKTHPQKDLANVLIAQANEKGGFDNITAALIIGEEANNG